MKKTFYSNGKLLITGEYLVLDGALALALPTKFGQDLVVENATDNAIAWKSFDSDALVWYEDVIHFDSIRSKRNDANNEVRNTLINILHEAFLLNPDFITNSEGYNITTNLTFPRKWGLGTSSTLINNIAQWLQVDAFALLRNSFGGSGYDIACAQSSGPITYQLEKENATTIKTVDFHPLFSKSLYFVYLNRKQNSKESIVTYRDKKATGIENQIIAVGEITEAIVFAKKLSDFSDEVQKHENLISQIIGIKPIGETLFSDFSGTVKSLGGWGGDFILAISKDDPAAYFQRKGFDTVIPYHEMVL